MRIVTRDCDLFHMDLSVFTFSANSGSVSEATRSLHFFPIWAIAPYDTQQKEAPNSRRLNRVCLNEIAIRCFYQEMIKIPDFAFEDVVFYNKSPFKIRENCRSRHNTTVRSGHNQETGPEPQETENTRHGQETCSFYTRAKM